MNEENDEITEKLLSHPVPKELTDIFKSLEKYHPEIVYVDTMTFKRYPKKNEDPIITEQRTAAEADS